MKESAAASMFLGSDINELVHPRFGETFKSIKPQFEDIKYLITEMIEIADNHKISESIIGQINNYINQWNAFFRRFTTLDFVNDPTRSLDEKNNLISQIINWHSSIITGIHREQGSSIATPYNFLEIYNYLKGLTFKTNEQRIKELLPNIEDIESFVSEFSKLKKEVTDSKNDFIKTVDDYKNTANEKLKEAGVSKFASIFKEESETFSKLSTKWMTAAVVVFILMLGCVVSLFLFVNINETSAFDIVQLSITKVVVISGGFYALSVCMKNYRAYKHNEVLNKHRHNALMTFETFTKSTEDLQTKNAVLLEATHSIFGNQSTGYSSNEGSDSDLPNKVIEIIKSPSHNS
jgi:predicted XRE-type DNA-binding protein